MPAATRTQDLRSTTQPQQRAASGAPAAAATPDLPSVLYVQQLPAWTLLEDVLAGTRQLREKAGTYLPQMPAELPEDWKIRVAQTTNYNCLERTVGGLAGMVFRRDPTLGNDVAAPLKTDFWENVDGAGTHGDLFARAVFELGLTYGHVGILTDYPAVAASTAAPADVLPYWCAYRAPDILSWRTATLNGQVRLVQLVLREKILAPQGDFGDAEVLQYRVFRLARVTEPTTGVVADVVAWELWRTTTSDAGSQQLAIAQAGILDGPTDIPFAVVYCGRRAGLLHTKPPLEDLAYTNIEYFQVRSDHRYSLHKASLPLFVTIGRDSDTPLVISTNQGINLPMGADAKYVEHEGRALGQTRQELQDLIQQMAAQGLAMLQRESRAAETAQAKRIDKSEQDSTLAAAARSLQDALEQSLGYAAQYLGLDASRGGSLMVNRDYEDLTLDGPTVTAYLGLHTANVLSLDTLWAMLERGGILPDDFDPAEEKDRLREAVITEPGTTGGGLLPPIRTTTGPTPPAPPQPAPLTAA